MIFQNSPASCRPRQTIDILRDYALQYPQGFELGQSIMTRIWLRPPDFPIKCPPRVPCSPSISCQYAPWGLSGKGRVFDKPWPLPPCLWSTPLLVPPTSRGMPDSVDIPAPLSAMAYLLSTKSSAPCLTRLSVSHPTITVISNKLPPAPAFLL